MKTKIYYLFLFLTTLLSCEKDSLESSTKDNLARLGDIAFLLDGNYSGTFERDGRVDQVQLSFNNGTYTGKTDTHWFPLLCDGVGDYEITNEKITFTRDCGWIAIVDMSLEISGDWDIILSKNGIILTNFIGDT